MPGGNQIEVLDATVPTVLDAGEVQDGEFLKRSGTTIVGIADPGAAAVATHEASASDVHAQYQKESEKDGANGYAGLNASSRITKGVDAGDIVNGTEIQVSGTKVVGAQGAAVSDAAGGGVIDVEARTALNALLARLRTHGLIAT